MTNLIKTFLTDTSGAAAAEYALILAIIGGTIAVGALALGNAVGTSLTEAATCVTTPTEENCD